MPSRLHWNEAAALQHNSAPAPSYPKCTPHPALHHPPVPTEPAEPQQWVSRTCTRHNNLPETLPGQAKPRGAQLGARRIIGCRGPVGDVPSLL